LHDPLTLGLTLAVLGMGGTLLTLFLFSVLIDLLKRLFPLRPEPHVAPAALSSPPPSAGSQTPSASGSAPPTSAEQA